MMMIKAVLALALSVGSVAGICVDDATFLDELGQPCTSYAALGSCLDAVGLTDLGLQRVLAACQLSCNSCVKANDYCEIGDGGDRYEPLPLVANFDFVEQPFLTDSCAWIDSPEGLRQTSNAWGNTPGENLLLGCMAILKTVTYTDFMMEVEMWHDDNDASGIIFGYNGESDYYQTAMHNDGWPGNPSDSVPGPYIKISQRNQLPCNGTMTADNDCYDLLAYKARDERQDIADYPGARLASMDYIPPEYTQVYEDFKFHNTDNRPVRFTLIVTQGQARVYFMSKNNRWVGTWTDLPASYQGGQVGLFMGAHQANVKSITIVDLTPGSTPLTTNCKNIGAVCDTTVGLCLGGPSPAPTSYPTFSPTYFENCQDPFRHAASDFCPNPVGGNVVTYDVTDITAWETIQQAPVSENCTWSADASGLTQSSNAWGTYPNSQLLVGCLALIGDPSITYTDFIAEYEAVHFDNDAWGFVFGYNGIFDHYTAVTHNDAWPNAAIDGINGPHTKIRKATGLPCLEDMDTTTACYEALGYTDADGYSDNGPTRESGPRSKEYEYTHAYAAAAMWQPHKITLIVKNGEARIIFKSPDTFQDTPLNSLRMGNRYQAAMAFDLKGYTGGRVGIFMSAHQMIINNFKVTDISDDANLPSGYCGGDAGSYCDSGVTGLCLGVAAADVCEGAIGATEYDTQLLETFDFIDDPTLGIACSWNYGPNGYVHQSSNAYRNEGTLLGCNAMIKDVEYTDFMMEIVLDNNDDDAVGFNFGWKADDDFFRVHKINDAWNLPNPLADYVQMPHMKIRRRLVGTSCAGVMTDANNCFETIAFIDNFGAFHKDIPFDAVTPAGECGYSQTYLPYDNSATSKMYLIVKDNQVRATFESPRSRRQVTVMNFDLTPYGYVGGRVGLFVFAHQAEFYRVAVSPLSGTGAITQFCNGDPCSPRTGRCLGSPTMSPTMAPTNSPTTVPTPNVAANEFCQGPVSATATTVVDTTDLSQFLLVDHPLLTTACAWSTAADGLTQSSEAWGNAPGDNTLMGCMAMFQGQMYTDFIAEIDVTQIDNDGWGVVFGYNAVDDQYLGIAMNDRWPLPAADGISGPFLKMKKHNGKEVLGQMDASNNCFDKLVHLDANGWDKDAMQGGTGVGLPFEYENSYPYRRGATFEDSKIVLIVKGTEARLYFPTPKVDRQTPWNNLRQTQTVTSTWTFDLQGYTGGMVGVFTYAHQATFTNMKITDITDPTAITAYCDGNPDMTCDNQRGDASTGLCHAVPVSDVCEGPLGDGVEVIDTTDLTQFEFIEDPYDLTTPCVWEIGADGYMRQSANTNRNQGVLLACNAIAWNKTYTDVLLQVDIGNDDDDAVGINFGWQSIDDHFRMHKINDIWPNPASDYVNGPGMKVKKKIPGKTCVDFGDTATVDDLCYTTIAFADPFGTWHDGMAMGAVAPSEYSQNYIPYDQQSMKKLILIIRGSAMRVMYEDVDAGKYVANFVFDLTPYGYVGGRVGLFTWAHQASFQNFLAAPLSGPTAVTTFCNGGTCDTRTGLCSTQPTSNPTSRFGDVAAADMCPGPVGGNTVTIDTTDITQFSFVDQEPLSEPCNWIIDGNGLKQTTNAWGNYAGPNGGPSGNWSEHVTITGCVALIGTAQYTDFMVEVTATHDDDDAWGFVFGYDDKGVVSNHIMAIANNDKWPDPAADTVRGPFIKMKKTNGNPCLGVMNMTYNCYDTLSYSDYSGGFVSDGDSFAFNPGRFNIDGMPVTDIPGEYYRTYPYKVDQVWPDRKMTLIVKDGEARLQVLGPEVVRDTPINSLRQPTKYVGTWSYDLGDYTGGRLGLFVYAHQATFYDLKITDLSTTMPTDYCNGEATCASSGVCVGVPVSDVCEGPVGATVVDLSTTNEFDYFDDFGVSTQCDWSARDLGKGPLLYQSTNAHRSLEGVGCNALYKGGEFTDFVMQIDVDNYDNDGVGMIFGWKSELDHFKLHKRIDTWPSPSPDWVDGPNFKVMKRMGEFPCIDGGVMNETNACYQSIAFADNGGVFHNGMPTDAVAPWQYASRYYDYEIGRGLNQTTARMVLMVRGNELRTYFTPQQAPELKVAAFVFDMSQYNYVGGQVGVYMYAHQAQFLDVRVAPLTGTGAVTQFCENMGTCNTLTGLCE